MSHGVAYFIWRNGRPRWSPGRSLRAVGAKGRDLKDHGGKWLPLGPALDLARELNSSVGHWKTNRSDRKSTKGRVYFLRMNDCVKIGFSTNVARRLPEFSTGMSGQMDMIVAISATKEDERSIHQAMWAYRRAGEWFDATSELLGFIGDCISLNSVPAAMERLEQARKKANKPKSHLRPVRPKTVRRTFF